MEAKIEDRPHHPIYGRALGGAAETVDGVTFYPYRMGVLRYVRASHDGRISVYTSNRSDTVYVCTVDGAILAKTFRKFETAARAGIIAIRASTR